MPRPLPRPSQHRQPRLALFRTIAIAIGLLLIVAALEGAAVLRLVDYRSVVDLVRGPQGVDVGFVSDPVLLYRRTPNSRWTGRPRTDMADYFSRPFRTDAAITFSTDGQGFRNPAVRTRADIVLIGDSYVEGWNVSDEQTASARLAALTGVTVANFGTAGYGSLQELHALEDYGLPLKPALVTWFFFEGNDLDDDQNFENAMLAEPGSSAVTAAEPWSHRWRGIVDRSFTGNLFAQLRWLTNAVIPDRVKTSGEFTDRGGVAHQIYFYDFYATRPIGDFERDRLRTTEATLRRAAEDCRQAGVTFIFYYVPIKFRVYAPFCRFPAASPCPGWRPWELEAAVRDICQRAGITFVSLTDRMQTAARGGALVYAPTDSHWNAEGQAFVASQIAAAWSASRAGLPR